MKIFQAPIIYVGECPKILTKVGTLINPNAVSLLVNAYVQWWDGVENDEFRGGYVDDQRPCKEGKRYEFIPPSTKF